MENEEVLAMNNYLDEIFDTNAEFKIIQQTEQSSKKFQTLFNGINDQMEIILENL